MSLISHQACELEAVDCTFKSLDTTSHSLTGDYAVHSDEDSDERIIHITHGYRKAHHTYLKQVIQEIIVSQDGEIPLVCKNLDGNTADTKVLKERAKALVEMLKNTKQPSYLVADCKLYHKENAEFLSQLTFNTATLDSGALQSCRWTGEKDHHQTSRTR